MKTMLMCMLSLGMFALKAQVGIGTNLPNASAKLDVTATDKGFLPPRMTAAQKTAIASPATGLLVYQTDSSPGYYYYNGSAWTAISGTSGATIVTNTTISGTAGTSVTHNSANAAQVYTNTIATTGIYLVSVSLKANVYNSIVGFIRLNTTDVAYSSAYYPTDDFVSLNMNAVVNATAGNTISVRVSCYSGTPAITGLITVTKL